MESDRHGTYILLSSIFWQWFYIDAEIIVAQSIRSMTMWTAMGNVLVIAAPSLYFCYRLRGMLETESSSQLAASTTAVSFICYILISSSYAIADGGWSSDTLYWQALQGFLTILLALFVFVPTLTRVSDKRIPKRQIRRIGRVRDRLHQILVKLLPQHVPKLMILAALVLPYGCGLFIDTYMYNLSFVSPLAGMFSIYYRIDHMTRTPFPPLRFGLAVQLGSTTAGPFALSILWLQLLYAHEVLRYIEGRTARKGVTRIGLPLLILLAFVGVLSGVVMILGTAHIAFIPFPVAFLVGSWLVKRKDRLLSKGDAEPVELATYLIHEEEVSVPIIYILESRLKKLLRRHKP